jgi:1-deoxy-D-xylulose-5-phosphate synthase
MMPMGNTALGAAKRVKKSVKELVLFNMFWEELGFTYLGPVDGHDMARLVEVLRRARTMRGPVLVHLYTTKGKGYDPAEADNEKLHSISPPNTPKPAAPNYDAVFGKTLGSIAETDRRVVAITAGMCSGTGLVEFSKTFADRFFDVGIAEEHAVTFAAGLATQGLRPVAAIYSTFLQRAFDQVIHDVCIQNLHVVFALDRAGVVGNDGRTHQGVFDLTYLRAIPNMVVMAPKDEGELRHMLFTALEHDGPVAVRYPRGAGRGVSLSEPLTAIEIGSSETLREGSDVAIVAIGATVMPACEAADLLAQQSIDATVVNARFAKPLDEGMLRDLARDFNHVFTVEENVLIGGFGSAVLEYYERAGITNVAVHRLGIPDRFIDHATQSQQRRELRIDATGIAEQVRTVVFATQTVTTGGS